MPWESETKTWKDKVEQTGFSFLVGGFCFVLLILSEIGSGISRFLEDPRERDPKVRIRR